MILLFTDFGYNGPYIGEVRSVLTRALTHQHVVDLMHDAPVFNPGASAYVLSALSKRFERGDICLAVVDPGVGDPERRVVMIEADGVTYVGPDNGLLSIVTQRAEKKHAMEVCWRPKELSSSFHGRDLFAPIVVKAALRESLDTRNIAVDTLVGMDWSPILAEVIYIDHYGNVVTGLDKNGISTDDVFTVNGNSIGHAEVFSQVGQGELFWYFNSMGLAELACNRGSAASVLELSIGDEVSVKT